MNRLLCLWLYLLKKFGNNIWWYYFILKRTHVENFFHHINNLHQNIKFTIEIKRELAFVDTVLRLNNEKISVLAYGKPIHTDQYLHYSSPHQSSCNESLVSSSFMSIFHYYLKDNLTKENAIIKQSLEENEHQESIISKSFSRIYNNYSLSQSQQQSQVTEVEEEEIWMSINLPSVEVISEKLQVILRSHQIGSTLYTESTFSNLLCKPKDWVATENKNNIIYEIDWSNCRAVYFGESKQSLKLCPDEHKRTASNYDHEKNEIVKHL